MSFLSKRGKFLNRTIILGIIFMFLFSLVPVVAPNPVAAAVDYTQSVTVVNSSSAKISFVPTTASNYVILHYSVSGGGQLNVNMVNNNGTWDYTIAGLSNNNVINYNFTYTKNGLQADSTAFSYTFTGVNSTPAPTPAPTPASITTGGTVTSSTAGSPAGEEKEKAFDGTTSTKWLTISSTGWIQYQLTSAKTVAQYSVASANDAPARDPKNWTLKGSNDGTSWTTLDTRTNQTFASRLQTNNYTFSNSTAYKYYRLDISANSGDSLLQLSEIGLFASNSSSVISGATYKLINQNSGKALDVTGLGTTDGTNVEIWSDNGSGAQKWQAFSNGDGTYKLINPNSGKALDINAAGTADGTNVQIWTDNGSGAQKWQIVSNTDGTSTLINPNSGKALDVSGSGTADGTNVQIWTSNGSGAQKWNLVQITTPTPTPIPTSNSIYSIPASSIPATGSGVMALKIMNGTNGAYPDSQVYWGVLGINPANGKWSYLDLNGNLVPISLALNDAAGHLTKNSVNYANIYHKISDAPWANMPLITSGRMFLCVGGPCYIKTFDAGFAGPDINNPADPNINVYFDFIEFTFDAAGYHGNTTRVDMYGFPVQHRLVNKEGSYDQTVGEFESETRSGLFTKYANEVPAAFKSLGTDQAPYRIVAPIHGSFNTGGANANYFAGYSSYSTQEILRCDGTLTNAQQCAAINRHVLADSNWNIVSNYYKAAPANYYAKFWHDHSINGLSYGFAYDDVNGQAAYLEIGNPKGLIIRVGW